MTPASALSRLEKLAHEHFKKVNPSLDPEYYLKPGNSMTVEAYIEGGKSMLSLLSEPGEACGPRVRIWLGKDTGMPVPEKYQDEHDERGDIDTEYCTVAELLQARAEIEHERDLRTGLSMQLDDERAALASSEARVRILSEALEKIAELQGSPIKSSAGWAGQVAREALLEVQR